MTERKYDTLLRASFAVLAVSAVMLCISTYNLYFGQKTAVAAAPSLSAANDTVRNLYSTALMKLDRDFLIARKNADTFSVEIDEKLVEFNRLRTEITNILKEQPSNPDYAPVLRKVAELQQKVDALNGIKSDVEAENERLRKMLAQLSGKTGATVVSTALPATLPERTNSDRPAEAYGPVSAAQLQLAMLTTSGNRDRETFTADEAQKIAGSFSLRNLPAASRAELIVVVLQPDGKVVRNSVWETGMFETREGRKVYSRKLFFDPSSDNRFLNFSLSPEKFWKGEYTMQVWYEGKMIGRMSKSLS